FTLERGAPGAAVPLQAGEDLALGDAGDPAVGVAGAADARIRGGGRAAAAAELRVQLRRRQPQVPGLAQRLQPGQLHALAARAAGVAVAAAAGDVAGHRDLVVGVGAEQRRFKLAAAGRAPLHAEFVVVADRRAQAEGEAGAAVGAVGKLVEGRGLEAAPGGSVDAQVFRRREGDAGHRRGFGVVDVAAVVRVARGDVVVARAEADLAAARAQQQRPARRDPPPGLGVEI